MNQNTVVNKEKQDLDKLISNLSPDQRKQVMLGALPTIIFRLHELTKNDKNFRTNVLELIKEYK